MTPVFTVVLLLWGAPLGLTMLAGLPALVSRRYRSRVETFLLG